MEEQVIRILDVEPPSVDTTVAIGQAEPGRNIFEGQHHEDLKSKAINQPVEVKHDDEKEISSFGGTDPASTSLVEPDRDDTTMVKDIKEETDDATVATIPEPTAGPQIEESAEAERARMELFPDTGVEA